MRVNPVYPRALSSIFLLTFFCIAPFARADDFLIVRPHAGYGYIDSSIAAATGGVSHAGARLLLSAGGNKKYGLEFSQFNLARGGHFNAFGIVIEQKLWNWFNMSIGTVGYFEFGGTPHNPSGVMTNLGWEPDAGGAFKPFITYRNDFIFYDGTQILYSISAGLTADF